MEVGQFIYMRLDKTESQRGVGGFQTLFFTRSMILETRMEEIESLLQFDAASDEPQLIFHPVGDQEVVLVQLQSIPDVDTCGRGGNFVAHGIVLSHDQFLSTGGNPITLANDTPFIGTGKDARCLGDVATGDIKPYEIPTNSINIPSEILEETRWTGPELRKLLATSGSTSRDTDMKAIF